MKCSPHGVFSRLQAPLCSSSHMASGLVCPFSSSPNTGMSDPYPSSCRKTWGSRSASSSGSISCLCCYSSACSSSTSLTDERLTSLNQSPLAFHAAVASGLGLDLIVFLDRCVESHKTQGKRHAIQLLHCAIYFEQRLLYRSEVLDILLGFSKSVSFCGYEIESGGAVTPSPSRHKRKTYGRHHLAEARSAESVAKAIPRFEAKNVSHAFYQDDVVLCEETEEEVNATVEDLIELFRKHGFTLREIPRIYRERRRDLYYLGTLCEYTSESKNF